MNLGNAPVQEKGPDPMVDIESLLPSSTPEPVVQDKPVPDAAFTPKKGSDIVIPKASMDSRSLAFLEGCWASGWNEASGWDNRNQFMAQERLCFDGKGNGRYNVTARQGKNDVFRGKAKARFAGRKVVVTTTNAKGRTGTWTPKTLELEGTGGDTMCYSVAVNPDNRRDVRRSRYHLYRD